MIKKLSLLIIIILAVSISLSLYSFNLTGSEEPSGPNLTILPGDIVVSDNNVTVGEIIEVDVIISNIGDQPATNTFKTHLYINETYSYSETVQSF